VNSALRGYGARRGYRVRGGSQLPATEPLVCRCREPLSFQTGFTAMASMSPPRVIVVEDEIMIRLPVVSALEAADFEVIEAGHAGEALAILEREAVRVHVVFTDVHMPGPITD
jgi:hypothetical protein